MNNTTNHQTFLSVETQKELIQEWFTLWRVREPEHHLPSAKDYPMFCKLIKDVEQLTNTKFLYSSGEWICLDQFITV